MSPERERMRKLKERLDIFAHSEDGPHVLQINTDDHGEAERIRRTLLMHKLRKRLPVESSIRENVIFFSKDGIVGGRKKSIDYYGTRRDCM